MHVHGRHKPSVMNFASQDTMSNHEALPRALPRITDWVFPLKRCSGNLRKSSGRCGYNVPKFRADLRGDATFIATIQNAGDASNGNCMLLVVQLRAAQ